MLKAIARAAASRPRAYELIQDLLGRKATWRRIRSFIPVSGGAWLDIGSSSGSFPALRDVSRRAFHLDIDILPLLLTRKRRPDALTVAADARALPFRSRSFDLTTCIAVSHHLRENILEAMLEEIARVTSAQFIFFDAVRLDNRFASRLLWRYDRGSHPRTREKLEQSLSRHFDIVQQLTYRVAHEYWLAVARPRQAGR